MRHTIIRLGLVLVFPIAAGAAEIHVAVDGDDGSPGTREAPLRTIQRAADLAQPGDVVTVHAGVYRERVNPPRGGTSPERRIVYQAAPGEAVEIRGSERIQTWEHVQGDVWKAVLPDSFFGETNPYAERIRGDWFDARGREHHTGAVYLNGDWLTEATSLDEVTRADGAKPAWLSNVRSPALVNLAWLQAGQDAAGRVPAAGFAAQAGVEKAPCSEGGECIGFIEHGDWVRYPAIELGSGTTTLTIRAAALAEPSVVEVRLDGPEGELLGTCRVRPTGDWQAWASFTTEIRAPGGARALCLLFRSAGATAAVDRGLNPRLWFGRVEGGQTTIWAQFPGVDPNAEEVEINARPCVFYPAEPGRDFITVRGFTMRHAATQWAPPTAEQVGLIGTHWSQGWIIEGNTISHSTCVGITLGKHGDAFDNTSADTAEGYVKTIERAHAFPIPWTRDRIGHHLVRDNRISHCEQAGIVGSLGAAFSTITGNTIHDIHIRRLFSGAEMAGIKLHGAIDTTISRNNVFRTCQALWLDWMAQGTRVTGNLFHDNEDRDLFLEVNHGPFLVDNNLFLSRTSLLDMSEGGAFAHNLFAGKLVSVPEPGRETPYHPAHSTAVAGLARIAGGEHRFYNNIFVGDGGEDDGQAGRQEDPRTAGGHGLWVYDFREAGLQTGGNIYYLGARPYEREQSPVLRLDVDPEIRLSSVSGQAHLWLTLDPAANHPVAPTVTTELLGNARVPGVGFENADGSPLSVDTDYLGRPRESMPPVAGPFDSGGSGPRGYRVW